MKKQNLIVIATAIFILVGAFSLFSWNTTSVEEVIKKENLATIDMNQNMVTEEFKTFPDFIYDIGPRFGGIKKSEIDNITTIDAFLDQDVIQNMSNIKSTRIIIFQDEKQSEISAYGNQNTLNKAQLQLLQNLPYSTSFVMRVDYDERDPQSGYVFDSYRSPHLTIVPEYQATYSEGKDALKLFLKESCQSVLVGVDPEKLRAAKLYFSVTKEGKIEDIHLDRASGYPEVDKKMMELITKTPGNWLPAKTIDGELVNQELVVSFGLMGC